MTEPRTGDRPFAWSDPDRLISVDELPARLDSHAQLPTPVHLEGDTYRLYFASRDSGQRSHVCWCDVELSASPRQLGPIRGPVLEPGPLGAFDDHGVYPSSVVEAEGNIFLYFIGWNPGKRAPLFYASVGLAISEDGGGTFEKVGNAPIMGRSEVDPLLVTAPVVRLVKGRWRMWYVSGLKWFEDEEGALHSRYHVRHAESDDGRSWRRDGEVSIDLRDQETNIARCWTVNLDSGWEAWYCAASPDQPYQLGYAHSEDGTDWTRRDDLVAEEPFGAFHPGAYPAVIVHGGRRHLFYNGAGFGRDGVWYAVEDPHGP